MRGKQRINGWYDNLPDNGRELDVLTSLMASLNGLLEKHEFFWRQRSQAVWLKD